jgi:hypothetical protein
VTQKNHHDEIKIGTWASHDSGTHVLIMQSDGFSVVDFYYMIDDDDDKIMYCTGEETSFH